MADEEKSQAPEPSVKSHRSAPPEVHETDTKKRGSWVRGIDGQPGPAQWFLAEFIGTLLLIYIGCGSCFFEDIGFRPPKKFSANGRSNDMPEQANPLVINGSIAGFYVSIGLVFGLTVASVAQAIGHISGCHLNPAVTLGLWVGGVFPCSRVLPYIFAQFLGSIAGSVLLIANKNLLNSTERFCITTIPKFEPQPIAAGVITEIILTFTLVLVVLGCCDSLRKDIKGSAPLAVGLFVALGIIMGVRYSGASMNPARSLGPAVVDVLIAQDDRFKALIHLPFYLIFPTVGGLLAGFVYRYLFAAATTNPPQEPSSPGQGTQVAPPPTSPSPESPEP